MDKLVTMQEKCIELTRISDLHIFELTGVITELETQIKRFEEQIRCEEAKLEVLKAFEYIIEEV